MWLVLLSVHTRIFHGKSIPACGRLMPTTLDSNFDLDGMKHTAAASKFFVRLVSMSLARRLTTIYHEIRASEEQEATAHRGGVYMEILDDSSTGATQLLTASVDCEDRFLNWPYQKALTPTSAIEAHY